MAPQAINPILGGRETVSSDRVLLTSVRGQPLADVGLVPRLLAQVAVDGLRRGGDGSPPDPAIFETAAQLFAHETVAGETYDAYAHNVMLSTGLTASSVSQATADIVTQLSELRAVTMAELPSAGFTSGFGTRWVPRGEVFTCLLASNHPAPNASWVQALFHGYRVLVRPGGRDPFTPHRLLGALLAAGLPPDSAAFVPCGHAVGEYLVDVADRALVYGGEQAVARWRGQESVAVRGPGRAKALLDVDPTDEVLDHLAFTASFDGGARCTNLSAVFTSRPVAEVADGLAERLTKIPALPATDPEAVLLTLDRTRADLLGGQLSRMRGDGLHDHSGQLDDRDTVVEVGDGSCVVRPSILSTDRADDSRLGTELPFPFVIVAPWHHDDGVVPLRDSLVLNLITDRRDLVDRAVREPSIRKVAGGLAVPWATAPGIPHDGNFTQFLLEPKGIIGDIAG
ncbi:arylcarboxylate reductase [Actinosynnema sp. ALI-1.44]|uniref:aldehyde dehydrogenase family protein n=1 Tax=Actinosynnema sp. ALI-1.44 TaxID=1933779 RepID=UPI00097CA1D4|nr:aldehyde dehydrogenase family protein [Actinosynnema sp. ALI-1.44]ONI88620.1 arylcarboxylate reductase [Actinosynnema sp. ALI-1.44]